MKIGELAQASGVSTRALRYYEAQGLLQARRRDNGYREYSESAVFRVRNIRVLLDAGLDTASLRDIDACLDEDFDVTPSCEMTIALFEQRLSVVTERLMALSGLRDRLEDRLQLLRQHSE